MKPNCHRIIVAAFKLDEAVFQGYRERLMEEIKVRFPAFEENRLEVVDEDDFVSNVLSDPHNVGICYAQIGMKESSALNHKKGIRAAVVHDKYIAERCRKHNDANVCVLGVECIGIGLSASIAADYLGSAFDNQERNMLRLGKILDFEEVPKP